MAKIKIGTFLLTFQQAGVVPTQPGPKILKEDILTDSGSRIDVSD